MQRGGKLVHLGNFATAEEAALCVARSPEGRKAAERVASALPQRRSEEEGQDNPPPAMPSRPVLEEEGTVPPMPAGAFVKEEVLPLMPVGAFFTEEVVVKPLRDAATEPTTTEPTAALTTCISGWAALPSDLQAHVFTYLTARRHADFGPAAGPLTTIDFLALAATCSSAWAIYSAGREQLWRAALGHRVKVSGGQP